MNIFVLDKDPKKAALYHADKHVIKMILESTQMMCTVANEYGYNTAYQSTHKNHPCTLWLKQSKQNWLWLKDLIVNLNSEYMHRFRHEKAHKSFIVACNIPVIKELPNIGLTEFAQAMPEKYQHSNAVAAYRRYYKNDKIHLFQWSRRDTPWWINE